MRPSLSFFFLLPGLALTACRTTHPQSIPASPGYQGPGALTLTGRLPNGLEIALSNRTKWSIQPAGASATLRWQSGEPLRLGASGEPTWPAAITSLATGATAFARPAGQF